MKESNAYSYTYYDAASIEHASEEACGGRVVASHGQNLRGGKDTYYILLSGGSCFDPNESVLNNRRTGMGEWRLRDVDYTAFQNYVFFLKTKRRTFKTICERHI